MLPLPTAETLRTKLQASGITIPEGPVRVEGFGDSPELSDKLLSLIISGDKRAGTSLLWAMEYEGEALPSVGQLEIVVNHLNEPVLLARITGVDVVPFVKVGAEYATMEGEGDRSLEYWRAAHWAFFERECIRIGKKPTLSMQVVCTTFEVLRVFHDAAFDHPRHLSVSSFGVLPMPHEEIRRSVHPVPFIVHLPGARGAEHP